MVDKLCYMDFSSHQEVTTYLDTPDEHWPDKTRRAFVKFVDWAKNRVWEYVADYWDVL